MKVVADLQGKSLTTVDSASVPRDVEELLLSNNNLSTLPLELFRNKVGLWKIDLSSNVLTDLSFLECFGALGYLDLRNNYLMIDELLQISHIYIAHLRIESNSFSQFTNSYPLTIPAILERVWVIDGEFISDFVRKQAKEFKETILFSDTVLACRRVPTSIAPHTSISQVAMTFLGGDKFRTKPPGDFMCSKGVSLNSNNDLPQIMRLKYLYEIHPIELPPGAFSDYFGLALGIMAMEWMDVPFEVIPRVTARRYWASNSELFNKLEPFERLLLLYKICQVAVPGNQYETGLWKALNAIRFVQTGNIPMLGSTARLVISAFLERAEEVPENIDRAFYLKIRQHGGFVGTSVNFEDIYQEIVAPIPHVAKQSPSPGDALFIQHPVSEKWMTVVCTFVRDGRVFTKVEGEIVQIPQAGLFWDGRGMWREAKAQTFERLGTGQVGDSFVTVSRTQEEEDQCPPPVQLTKTMFPEFREPKVSDPLGIVKTSMRRMNTTKFINRASKPVETFRGISQPVAPQRRSLSRGPSHRPPSQFIQDVVNVTTGPDIGYGRQLRRFNVRVENVMTHKSRYVWINEDEVSPEDTARLISLYRRHIQSKLKIVPD